MADFGKAFKKTMKFEGGWVNDPKDSGGETYRGVTRKNFQNWPGWPIIDEYKKVYKTIKKLNVALAADTKLQALIPPFYKSQFWDVIKLDYISSQVLAENVFDFGVNAYYRTAAKRLQEVVGVKPDGVIGSKTLEAVETKLRSIGEKALVNAYIDARVAHYDAIVRKKESQKKFYKGWINRCNELRNEVNKLGSGYAYGGSVNSNPSLKDLPNNSKNSSDSNTTEIISMSKLDKLNPKLQELAKKHIVKCKETGIDLNIYCTYRSIEDQDALYSQGRTAPGKIVTNAKGGRSYHNFGVAYDCGPILNRKIAWNRTDLFKKIGVIGESVGLEWGGRFKSIVDLPHFQYTRGLSLADFRAGKTLENRNVQHRASGGSVNSNSPYIVGEEGMELFVPNTNGTILNNTILKALLNNSLNSRANNIFNSAAIQTELGSSQSEANLKSPLTILTETLVKLNSTINKYTSHFTSEMGQTETGTNVKSSSANLSVEAEANQESSSETSEIGQGETQTGSWENLLGKWNENLQKSISQMTNWSTNMKSVASTAVQSLQLTMNTVFSDAVQGNLKSFKDYFKSFANNILQYLSSMLVNKIMGKAEGGAVAGGTTYLVGEQGPELFVPNTSGTIVPNNQLGGGLTIKSINVVNNTGVQTTATTSTQIDTDGYVVNVILNALATNKGGLRDALAR